ncbi:MFS transporter [Curtobacterium sp. MCPF17_047]|uniref:MFS transporter n=1 Tax=Curtobacterium sp. MCPF17_047 TaxID=2175654 RepID=UPI000DAA2B9D|nr:MFS transporter [Curtobacterium sp. MCPF17_047]PZF61646.1 MFS transporter [Curtobacterium sp. MCPF17_047]
MSTTADAGQQTRPIPKVASLALLSAVAAFSVLQSMVLPALPEIREDLHASVSASSWVLSAFLLVSSVSAVTLGRLGDMFGKKRLLLVSVGALLAGSVIAALAPSITVLVTARAVQGIGAAAFPLAYGLVREIVPSNRVPTVIGAVSSTFGIGFAVGLVLPAPLLAAGGWPAVFWLSSLVDLAALVLIAVTIPESADRVPGRVDWWGAVLLALALSAVLLAISETRAWPPPVVLTVAAVGVVALVVFVLLELRIEEPLVQPRLLRNPAVLAANVGGLLVGFALYGAFSIIPQFVQTPPALGYGFGATSLQAGLLLLPTAVTMVLVGPMAGRAGIRFGHAQTLVAAGITGVVGYAFLVLAADSIWAIIACTTILGVAVGLALTAMVNLIVEAVDPTVTGQATGLNTILRTIGGALGAQITGAIIASSSATQAPGTGYRIAFASCGVALALVAAVALTARRRSAR